MSVDHLLDMISDMEKKQSEIAKEKQKINFKSFNFNRLFFSTTEIIFEIIRDTERLEMDLNYYLNDIFDIERHVADQFLVHERVKAVDMAVNHLKSMESDESCFYHLFDRSFFKEKDRLRAIVSGNKMIISKEKEQELFTTFLEFSRIIYQYYFHLIPYEEIGPLFLPHFLKCIENKKYLRLQYDYMNDLRSIRDLFGNEAWEIQKKSVYDWYQNNGFSFIQDYEYFSIHVLENWGFLLNKAQKQTCFEKVYQKEIKAVSQLRKKFENKPHDMVDFSKEIADQKERLLVLKKWAIENGINEV